MSAIRNSWLFRIPHKTAGKSYSSTKQKTKPLLNLHMVAFIRLLSSKMPVELTPTLPNSRMVGYLFKVELCLNHVLQL